MNNLNEFIKQLFELNIEIEDMDEDNSFLSLNHYFESDQSYSTQLKMLAEMAISDVLTLTPEQVKWQLTRFDKFRTDLCEDVEDSLSLIDALLERDKEEFDLKFWLLRIGETLNFNLNNETLIVVPVHEDDVKDFVEQLNKICEIKSNILERFYENLREITQNESKYDEKIRKDSDKYQKGVFKKIDMRVFSYILDGVPEDEFDEFYFTISPYVDGTREEVFNVFYGASLKNIKPLKWKSNNASELLYFIIQLMEKGLMKHEKRIDYNRLKTCFVKANGSNFDEKFKDLNQKLDTSLSKAKKEAIDTLIEKFL